MNGDGNGILSVVPGPDVDLDGVQEYEYLRASQHLALANMIQGLYTGEPVDPATKFYEVGTNVIPAKCCSRGGFVLWDNSTSSPAKYIGPAYYNSKFLILGGIRNNNNIQEFITSTITPVDAFAIDSKNDDGIAYSGATFGLASTHKGGGLYIPNFCSSSYLSAGVGGGDYDLTNDFEPACSMYFILEK